MNNRIKTCFLGIVLSLQLAAQSPDWTVAGLPLFGRAIQCLYTDTTTNLLYATGMIIRSPGDYSDFFICKYNGTTWDTLGGFNQKVYSLGTYNGDLIAAGSFTMINSDTIFSIARYDGISWHAMGSFDQQVEKIRVIGTDLYAMGSFDSINGMAAHGIAKWNGLNWSDVYSFSPDNSGHTVYDVTSYKGNLYVCGNFYNPVLGLNNIAEYTPSGWQNLSGGVHGGWTNLTEMVTYKNFLYVGGTIIKPDGNPGHMIQRWNDTIWSEVGNSVRDLSNGYGFCSITDLLVYQNNLYVCGAFGFAGNIPAAEIARWDGTQWCGYGTTGLFTTGAGIDACMALGIYNDTLYLGLANDTLNGVHTNRCIKYMKGLSVDTCSILYTAIDEVSNFDELTLYPNPATNKINIEVNLSENRNIQIEIKNILGQPIQKIDAKLSNGKNKIEIDVSALPNGLYFVQMQSEKGLDSKKFMKQ